MGCLPYTVYSAFIIVSYLSVISKHIIENTDAILILFLSICYQPVKSRSYLIMEIINVVYSKDALSVNRQGVLFSLGEELNVVHLLLFL